MAFSLDERCAPEAPWGRDAVVALHSSWPVRFTNRMATGATRL
jgi:hypothetical protein